MSEEATLDEFTPQNESDEQRQKWRKVKLHELVYKRSDNVNPQEVELERHVGLEHINPNDPVPEWEPLDDLSSTKRRFEAGDILFAKLRPNLEKSAQPGFDGVASTDIFPIVAETDINSKWLLYRLSSKPAYDYARRTSAGTRMPRTSWNLFSNFSFDLPPLPEQRKIATVLYTVDRAIEKTEEVIDTYEAVQKGILRESISRGVTEDGEFRPDSDENPDLYSETRWGQIPEAWDTEKVSELVVDDKSVTYGIVKAGEHVPGGVPMIRGENYISGWQPLSEFFRVSEEIHKEYNRSAVRSGDILLAVAGANAGAVNIVPEWMPDEVNISRSTARISVDDSDVIPEFMRYVIESPFLRKQIHAWKKGSAQDVLNLVDVKKFQIPLPPIDEQNRIVSILSNMREGELKERTIKNQYSRLKHGLIQDLLSGTVRTTDTNIEVPEEIAKYG